MSYYMHHDITWNLHTILHSYYIQITYKLHLCNIYVITWNYMKLHEILHKCYGNLIEFIIKVLNWGECSCNYMNWSCNYMLQTHHMKFTRIFHTGYIIHASILHALCRINVIQHVMTYAPLSESRGVRHYMLFTWLLRAYYIEHVICM